MKYLSQLTPAEVLLLTKDGVTHRELLKLTFIDLLLKQVLKTFEVERRPHAKDKIRVYIYVGIGKNFENYTSHNHERVFLSPFSTDHSTEILFTNLVKIAYQKSRTVQQYKEDVANTPTLKRCFSQNFLQKIFYHYSTTEYGKELKKEVKEEILNQGNKLADLTTIEAHIAVEMIKEIGANIFLLTNVDNELLSQIDKDFGNLITQDKNSNTGGGCSSWSFDDYSTSFDSSCGGHGCSGGGSGCGSGCSGCGGCGGD